jgi:membrane protein implicated in regulation of membrane protease activity
VIGLYIACGILGVGLILLSALGSVFGGHDADASSADLGGHSPDAALDGPQEVSHVDWTQVGAKTFEKGIESVHTSGLWLPFFSLRFWTYFLGGFGLLGTLLTLFKQGTEPLVGIVSSATGLFLGLVAAYAWRILIRQQVDASTKEADFLGVIGTQSVAARGHEPGKVRVMVRGELIDLLALSDDGQTISAGEEVVVVGIEGDHARVTRKDQLFPNE